MSVRERSCARSLKCALCTESIIDSFDIYRRRRLMFNDVQELVIAKKAKKSGDQSAICVCITFLVPRSPRGVFMQISKSREGSLVRYNYKESFATKGCRGSGLAWRIIVGILPDWDRSSMT